MSGPLTCLVTIHGIGFEEPPDDGQGMPGYADDLHSMLREVIPGLGDDPERGHGAVYVAGPSPTSMDRLDPSRPLATPGAHCAHVALVYTCFEESMPDPLGLFAIILWSVRYARSYITARGAVQMLVGTLQSLRRKGSPGATSYPGSLRLRDEAQRRQLRNRMRRHPRRREPNRRPSGPFSIVWQVSQDVGGYVARHKYRERVRSFVEAVLTSLSCREDVRAIVLNTHSNGTVVGFDVLSDLDPSTDLKIRGLVTAGSPLRKYADLLGWGTDAGRLCPRRWINVWDRRDPVADSLQPPVTWRRGQPHTGGPGLFHRWSPAEGELGPVTVTDRMVDNVQDARPGGGGLRSHDYWANPGFCQILADLHDEVERESE